MKIIELSAVGVGAPGPLVRWDDLGLRNPWRSIVDEIAPGSEPSDIQVRAITDGELLTSRRNLIVAGPTNSGKSLLAYLTLLHGARAGRRTLLLEPLRAIAQEKWEELDGLTTRMEGDLGRKIAVDITTGDYRLKEETMDCPPPESGEVVIATPERIEAILRCPAYDTWVRSFSVVCVDEAHMIGDSQRGATLEYVITSFKMLQAPPRLVLFSATLGDTTSIERWLEPCNAAISAIRRPPLERCIHEIEQGEDPKQALIGTVQSILSSDSRHSVLVFVYQKAWASSLAAELSALGTICGPDGAQAYHSNLSTATKAKVRGLFLEGRCRCIVTTAALAMGVNLPATHVIVRDLQYGPGRPIEIGPLLQMAGRAGRGSRAGSAVFFRKATDAWKTSELREAMEESRVMEIRSVFGAEGDKGSEEPALAETLLSLLSRQMETGTTEADLASFFSSSLAGQQGNHNIPHTLKWLAGQGRLLAYKEGGVWKATRLGEAAIRASAPLSAASGLAQLIRDLLSVDADDVILRKWTGLDLLILSELLATRGGARKSFSEPFAKLVDAAFEQSQVKSVIFNSWIRGARGFSKAAELMGSLGLQQQVKSGWDADRARQAGYLAAWRAMLLWQRSQGVGCTDLERQWGIKDLAEIEESWRDDRLFLIGAIRGVFDLKCIFFHLKEECQADTDRILRVKRSLQRIRLINLQTLNLLSWCSPLGSVFLRLRSATGSGRQSPAKATMQKLEESGINSAAVLAQLSETELVQRGVRKDFARAITVFLRRR
jgi:helicase